MKTAIQLPANLRQLAEKHFVLLESQNVKKKRDTIQLNLSGYGDVMYLIADITKVCMLALDGAQLDNCSCIPEPTTNIVGVLGIILDLLPYEEMEFLDKVRAGVLDPEEAPWEEFVLENLFLSTPSALQN